VTFIAMGFAFQIFSAPAIAVVPMFLIVIAYAAKIRLPLGLPAGFVAICLGVAIAWGLRWAGFPVFTTPSGGLSFGLHLPKPDLAGWGTLFAGYWGYLTVIVPMALFNVLGSLQTLESAEAAGDRYETKSSLMVNGLGSIAAAFFGSAFPTTIYIGHPGWKAMGARIGYSGLNGIVICVLCFTGAVGAVLHIVPIETTLGILIWIGLVMVAQAFQETPKAHAIAVAAGLIPSLAAWALLLIETTLRIAGMPLETAIPKFGSDLFIGGVIALNQGFLLTSMAFAAIVAFAIDRRFTAAAVVCFLCAVFSAVGLIHSYALGPGGLRPEFGWMAAPGFAAAYAVTGVILLALRWLNRFDQTHGALDG